MKLKTFWISVLTIVVLSSALAGERYTTETYQPVIPPQPTQTGDKIEVLEFFWYGCTHCYDIEPYLDSWLEKKPDDVEFRRMPAILGERWIPHARAYFVAEKLGIADQIHRPLFDAIHKEGEHITDENSLKRFYTKYGVDGDEFSTIFNSPEIEGKVKESFVMGQRYKVTGVPTIIVNGKYRTSVSMTGSNENLIMVINQLVKIEQQNFHKARVESLAQQPTKQSQIESLAQQPAKQSQISHQLKIWLLVFAVVVISAISVFWIYTRKERQKKIVQE